MAPTARSGAASESWSLYHPRSSRKRSVTPPVVFPVTQSKSPAVPAPAGFKSLHLHPLILKAVEAEGYSIPTAIQAQTIPIGLSGRDVLGIAQTGTGKTAAFALPILHRLKSAEHAHGHSARRPRALILAPTRELAAQIGESFATYGRNLHLRHAVIFGGVGQRPQVKALQGGVDIIIATPGRLIDLMEQGFVHLDAVNTFVLDEADRMLDMGFIKPIQRIAARVPKKRQTMLFSATMPSEIQHLVNQLLHDPVRVAVTPEATTVDKITQELIHVPRAHKVPLLVHLLQDPAMQRVVAFTKTKHGADRVLRRLHAHGIAADAIHGNKGQNHRVRALLAFREGHVRVLVATDIAARGLDIDGITHVVNIDLPMEPEAYVHRIGRTARAGASGAAISFCDHEERGLLRSIERLTRQSIHVKQIPAGLSLAEPHPSAAIRPAHAAHAPKGGGHGDSGSGGSGSRGGRRGGRRGGSRGGSRGDGRGSSRGDGRGENRGAKPGGSGETGTNAKPPRSPLSSGWNKPTRGRR